MLGEDIAGIGLYIGIRRLTIYLLGCTSFVTPLIFVPSVRRGDKASDWRPPQSWESVRGRHDKAYCYGN
jgi:hypothetical protein